MPKETVWQLLSHFFNDITHFDGKFFSTSKDLILRPGFLSGEYLKGRRARYLNPIRMYLFTSFLFFLIFFSFFHFGKIELDTNSLINGKTIEEVNKMDQKDFDSFTSLLNKGTPLSREAFIAYADSVKNSKKIYFNLSDRNYKTRKVYDSLLASGAKKDGWLRKKIVYNEIKLNEKYGNDQGKLLSSLLENLVHHFPQMLFISLPFMALFLRLLYLRHKDFFYVSHVIFVVHVYIFIFLVLLLSLGISKLDDALNWDWLNYINWLVAIMTFFYLYKAMRNFYKQRRAKTIIKFFLLLFSFLFLTIFLFVSFFFVSFFQV